MTSPTAWSAPAPHLCNRQRPPHPPCRTRPRLPGHLPRPPPPPMLPGTESDNTSPPHPRALREDRLIAAAHATDGDARHLTGLFGLSTNSVLRHTRTVTHPPAWRPCSDHAMGSRRPGRTQLTVIIARIKELLTRKARSTPKLAVDPKNDSPPIQSTLTRPHPKMIEWMAGIGGRTGRQPDSGSTCDSSRPGHPRP